MVTLIRVEAEGPALPNVTRDLDEVEAAFKKKASTDLRVHDEHYERVHDTLFKGRRVYRLGGKPVGTTVASSDHATAANGVAWSYTA